nr:hypothetical protein [Desulfuromonadales bacterium]
MGIVQDGIGIDDVDLAAPGNLDVRHELALLLIDHGRLQGRFRPRLAGRDLLEIDDAVLDRTAFTDDDQRFLAHAAANLLVLGRQHRSHLDWAVVDHLSRDGATVRDRAFLVTGGQRRCGERDQ